MAFSCLGNDRLLSRAMRLPYNGKEDAFRQIVYLVYVNLKNACEKNSR